MSARELTKESVPAPLDPYQSTTANGFPYVYPGFGWEGSCVDKAVGTDSPEAMQFCHDQGFIDHTTVTFFNKRLRALCDERAPKCAAVLAKLGYPQ